MSINGFNPNLFMNTMAATPASNIVSGQPTSLMASPVAEESILSGAALDTSNPMNALGQLFSMLASLISQLFSGLAGVAPAQNTLAAEPQSSSEQTQAASESDSGSILNNLALMLQELIQNMASGQAEDSAALDSSMIPESQIAADIDNNGEVAADDPAVATYDDPAVVSYDTPADEVAADDAGVATYDDPAVVSYDTPADEVIADDSAVVAEDNPVVVSYDTPLDEVTAEEQPVVVNNTSTGDNSTVTTTTNDAGRDVQNITTTISDSGNTYNITIQMQPGRHRGGRNHLADRGNGYAPPQVPGSSFYRQPEQDGPVAEQPPTYDQAPPPMPSYQNLHVKPNGGTINNNTTNINEGDGTINNNTTNINNGGGTINNNTTNINEGDGTINNNTTNINEGGGTINNNDTNINEGDGTINNNTTNINNGGGTINNNTTNINGTEDCEPTPPPPVEEECPPPPPVYDDNNDSQYYGDPHFVGFGGEKYDVMGEVGKTYNILSDKNLQYNAEFAAWGAPDQNGVQPTVINKAGITSGKDQIVYDLNGGAPKLNGSAMETGREYTLDAHGKAKWDGSKMYFENNEYSIDLSQDPRSKDAILSNVKVRDGVNPLADGVTPHGLLGQTADGVKGERVGLNADGSVKTDKANKQGGTVIDGDHSDYQVSGLLDIQFGKHNQFVA